MISLVLPLSHGISKAKIDSWFFLYSFQLYNTYDVIPDIKPYGESHTLGFGKKNVIGKSLEKKFDKFYKYYSALEFDGINYKKNYNFDRDSVFVRKPVNNFILGMAYGYIYYNGLTYSISFENTNFKTFSINFSIGLNFSYFNRNSSISIELPFNKKIYNVNKNAFQISLQTNINKIDSLLITPIDINSSSNSVKVNYTNQCHIFGKIKLVDNDFEGDAIKVIFVDKPFEIEDLKIKYVNIDANSPGKWQIVDYGEDYRVQIVNKDLTGKAIKVKEVTLGEGCP